MILHNVLLFIVFFMIPMVAAAHSGEVDFNGDGQLSLAEVRAAMPNFTRAAFAQVDLNGNGLLNDREIALGVQVGWLSSFFD